MNDIKHSSMNTTLDSEINSLPGRVLYRANLSFWAPSIPFWGPSLGHKFSTWCIAPNEQSCFQKIAIGLYK